MNFDIKLLIEIDWNEIEFENMGDWFIVVKVMCCIFVVVIVFYFSYSLLVFDEIVNYYSLVVKEIELRNIYKVKYVVVSNLDLYC